MNQIRQFGRSQEMEEELRNQLYEENRQLTDKFVKFQEKFNYERKGILFFDQIRIWHNIIPEHVYSHHKYNILKVKKQQFE